MPGALYLGRVDILPVLTAPFTRHSGAFIRHSGASRNLMLLPLFSSVLTAEFAPEIGAETAPGSCGAHPVAIYPHGPAQRRGNGNA